MDGKWTEGARSLQGRIIRGWSSAANSPPHQTSGRKPAQSARLPRLSSRSGLRARHRRRRANGPSPDVHPRVHKAMIDAMRSVLAELREQIEARYADRGDAHGRLGALVSARCESARGVGEMLVAAEKQDCPDSFKPPEHRPLIAVDRLLLDAYTGQGGVVTASYGERRRDQRSLRSGSRQSAPPALAPADSSCVAQALARSDGGLKVSDGASAPSCCCAG